MPTIKTLLPLLGAAVAMAQSEGCYSSAGSLDNQGVYIYQSTGYCTETCRNAGKSVIATTKGNECYCGDELPPASDKVEDSMCDTLCVGYPADRCGGDGYWSVSTIDGSTSTTSASMSAPASTAIAAPTAGMNATTTSSPSTSASTSSTPSTSTSAEYTGAAARPVVGAGALAIGGLLALL